MDWIEYGKQIEARLGYRCIEQQKTCYFFALEAYKACNPRPELVENENLEIEVESVGTLTTWLWKPHAYSGFPRGPYNWAAYVRSGNYAAITQESVDHALNHSLQNVTAYSLQAGGVSLPIHMCIS